MPRDNSFFGFPSRNANDLLSAHGGNPDRKSSIDSPAPNSRGEFDRNARAAKTGVPPLTSRSREITDVMN